jgi:protein gp37
MSETKIEWADLTGGPWLGCEPVSPGCANCYAWALAEGRHVMIFRNAYRKAGFEDWATRPVWGRNATRVLTKGFWKDARRINAQLAKSNERRSWFPSLMDWLDLMPGGIIDQDGKQLDPNRVRADFLRLVRECGNIDWLLLTKRPENFGNLFIKAAFAGMTEMVGGAVSNEFTEWLDEWRLGNRIPENVFLGVSAEDQDRADARREHFRKMSSRKKFVSYEPALGNVDWAGWEFVDQIIFGGESGPESRDCDIQWGLNALEFCRSTGVKFFCKQLGARPVSYHPQVDDWPSSAMIRHGSPYSIGLVHPKGGDPEEWPAVLRVREDL